MGLEGGRMEGAEWETEGAMEAAVTTRGATEVTGGAAETTGGTFWRLGAGASIADGRDA